MHLLAIKLFPGIQYSPLDFNESNIPVVMYIFISTLLIHSFLQRSYCSLDITFVL